METTKRQMTITMVKIMTIMVIYVAHVMATLMAKGVKADVDECYSLPALCNLRPFRHLLPTGISH